MKRAVRVVAVLATVALFAAACGKKNPEPAASGGGGGGAGSTLGAGKQMCEVTDTGGINDKSFNATAYKGLTDAETDFGITAKYLQSDTADDYAPNIQAFLGKCDLIVSVGIAFSY